MIERWTITDREEWLQRRRANINGSEVAALFGCNPWMTNLALYAQKAGLVDMPVLDNDALLRGRIMEPSVAEAVRIKHPDWDVTKATEYLWSPQWRLGCTPDFHVVCPVKGRGVMQAKTTSPDKFEQEWQDGPPQWIVLQALQEMMLEEMEWGMVAVLVCAFPFKVELHEYPFERHAPAEKRIIAKTAVFWDDVAARRQPKFNFEEDADIIKALFPRDNGVTIDFTGDNRLPELLTEFEALSAAGKQAENKLKAVKAEIAAKLGDASRATLPGWEVSNKTQERAGFTVAPTSFRVLRVKRTDKQEMAA